MTDGQSQKAPGALLRGADGTLYWISAATLEQCRVPEEQVAQAQGGLDEKEVQGYQIINNNLAANSVSGFSGLMGSPVDGCETAHINMFTGLGG